MESIASVMKKYQKKIRLAAKAQGYDIPLVSETPEQRQKRKRQEELDATAGLRRRKVDEIYRTSLWSSGIPIEFAFSEWKPEMQPNHAKAKELGNQAYKLALMLEQGAFNIAMFGGVGVGKTSLALAIMSHLMDKGQTGMFVSTAELQELYRLKGELEDVASKLRLTLKAMKEADVLILDDFGTEGGLDGRTVRLDMQGGIYQVSNARLDKTTIITTNNSPKELAQVYDRKIISRLIPKRPEQQLSFVNMEGVRRV